jgi:flagellin
MATVDVTRIASNIGALNALNSLQNINKQLAVHQGRLQTGKRINSASDDPAGLTIATKMLARSEGMKVALDNISDAKNMLSVAESGMSKINDILVQMRSKAEQAASDTLGSSERSAIQTQLSSYAQQIQDLVDQTKWNGTKLLDTTTGTKTFQTGADQGDNVQWTLADKLDPTSLSVSQSNTSETTTLVLNTGATFTGQASTAALSGLSKLDTGGYSVEILDKATAGVGKVNTSGTMPSGTSSLVASAAATSTELTSGSYTFEITGGTNLAARTNVNYRVLKADGSVAFSDTGKDLAASGGVFELTDGTGTVGMTITTTGALTSGQKLGFEYIKRGFEKYELNDASGVAQTVSKDGVSGTNTAQYGYFSAAAPATVDTGRGFTFQAAAIGTGVVGDSRSFNFLAAGSYVVDVSSATKAAQYMTTVNSALDVVNKGMSNLGSLMARLTFKEDATANAQVNVESSYSRIMNANMAEEQVNASKFAILQQTATAMLAQANQAPQSLLSLFR